MTQMGLDFLKYSESVRSNRAQEALKADSNSEAERSNRAEESIKRRQLEESTRHNIATESVDSGKLAEQIRTNQANEGIKLSQLTESARHNKETESQATKELKERRRSNKVNEAETERSHRTSEAIDLISAGSKGIQHKISSSLVGAGIAGLGLSKLIYEDLPESVKNPDVLVQSSKGKISKGRVTK